MIEHSVLPAPYPRQMKDHFNRLSDELQLARGWAADAATWAERRPRVRAALIEAMGGFPERTPLHAEVVGTIERDGYTIEKIVYQSRPDFYVTGALYVPHVTHPVPGIFCPHGHYAHGRYDPTVQARLVGHARRGYVALAIDAVGYNDREPQNHGTRAGFLYGQANEGLQIWDNIRGIDYLCSRPEVLSERIGCTGCSGGGNQTMYTSALDERIVAAVPVCSVELGECYMHKRFCGCETIPGLRRFADLVDVTGLIAPRALLLIHGIRDSGFLIDSARKAFNRLRLIYQALGVPHRLEHFTSFDEHSYNPEMRQAAFDWFDLHLKGIAPSPVPVGEPVIESDADLRCLPAGLPAKAHSQISLYHRATAQLPVREAVSSAAEWLTAAETLRRALADLLGDVPPVTPLRPHEVGRETETIGGVEATVETVYLYTEPDVVVPGALYRPAGVERVEVMIRFGTDGRRDVPETAIAEDLAAGRATFALDPRGMGETRAPDFQISDWQAWLSSVTLGRHFAAMRAWDVRRAAEWLLARDDVSAVGVGAHGTLLEGLVALLAAAADGRLERVEIERLLLTYKHQDDFGELASAGQLAVIPRLLTVADIDDLLALVAPRPVVVEQFVNGLAEPVGGAGDLARCRQIYRLLDADAALRLPE